MKCFKEITEDQWILIVIIMLVAGFLASVFIYDHYHPVKPDPHPGITIHYVEGHIYISKSGNSSVTHAEHCPCKKRD